jgi:TPR repeat protein
LISVLWLLTSVAARADFDVGMAAYERGDFTTAMTEWLPTADPGDAEAQFQVGVLYSYGDGIEEDDAKTLYWYRKASKQGHPGATYPQRDLTARLEAWFAGLGIDEKEFLAVARIVDPDTVEQSVLADAFLATHRALG